MVAEQIRAPWCPPVSVSKRQHFPRPPSRQTSPLKFENVVPGAWIFVFSYIIFSAVERAGGTQEELLPYVLFVEIYLEKSGKFFQVAPITDEFCREYVGTNAGDWNHNRAAFVRRDERWCARGRERPLLQLVHSDNQRSRGWPQHHAGVAVSPPCSMCLFVRTWFGVYALSLWEGRRKSGPAQPAAPWRTLIRTEATGARFECLRVARPQHHLHQTTISAAAAAAASSQWIRALALACSSGQTPCLQWLGCVSRQISDGVSTAEIFATLSGNVRRVLILVLIPKQSLCFRTYW